ncbi:MAG: AAA family ATPase [Desulfuromonadales bacterium]|nr:AAA family ATPase [Desulfuromonadales bacterium]
MKLQSMRTRNFKAIVDSRMVRLGALTAFVGHNGSGKSSLVEALSTYQAVVRDGLDIAMQRWMGIEHVRHKAAEAKVRLGKPVNPITFELVIGPSPRGASRVEMEVNNDSAANTMFISDERVTYPDKTIDSRYPIGVSNILKPFVYGNGRSFLTAPMPRGSELTAHILGWQFLTMQPEVMGRPAPQQRTEGRIRLNSDGSNIADYLLDIRRIDKNAFDGIVETMAYVLPYARDLQPSVTSELERKAYLQMTEADFKVPGWMLSTGTLRMLALLALLRHPNPPPLIVVEEIENGLDPRSIHLIVEEIRSVVLSGVTQVILTTHSPYLLDLLTLEHLVLVERDAKGQPRFIRPADNAGLQKWARDFAPGKLYTMGSLSGGNP